MTRAFAIAAAIAAVAGGLGTMGVPKVAAAAPVADDWSTYLHDNARTAASNDTTLSNVSGPSLGLNWKYKTANLIAASPAIVNGIIYEGSWDGYEYAICAQSCVVSGTPYGPGQVIWKTNLGQTTNANCPTSKVAGVTSGATVQNGVVYVGGGDSNFYALDATTGAVLGSVPTGDNTPAGGHYNWSSPLVANGNVYIGIASNCDNPLVQGELLQVPVTGLLNGTGTIANVAKFVPDGQVGGGIWTSPTLDATTNTIFVSTGTIDQYTQQLSQAVVALDANTLAVKDHWQLPFQTATDDSDWGTTPTLLTDSNGRQLVAVANKNGILYAFLRSNLSQGPVWQLTIARGGACPTCGEGVISSSAFAPSLTVGGYTGPVLFQANGGAVINGTGYKGVVRAINPANGTVLWTHTLTQGAVLGALAYDNGLLAYGNGNIVEVADATTGTDLYDFATGAVVYAAGAFSHGQLVIGSTDYSIYDFQVVPQPSPPADANCPSGFTCQDIGSPPVAGSETASGNSVTVTASGLGARHASDQGRFISEPVSGDFQINVTDMQQTGGGFNGGDAPQLGIMIRQSAFPGAPFYAVLQDYVYRNESETQANMIIFYRTTWNAPVIETTQLYPAPFPRQMIVERKGDWFYTLTTSDGTHYYELSGGQTRVVMPTTLMGGMWLSAGCTNTCINYNGNSIAPNPTTTATYQGFTVGPPTTPWSCPTQTFGCTNHPCPASWTCQDVNSANPPGDQQVSNGTWTVYGSGAGITGDDYSKGKYGAEDSFHLAYQSLTGDQTLTAQYTGYGTVYGCGLGPCQPSNNAPPAGAQAGLMMRATMDPGSPYYAVLMYPNGDGEVQWRTDSNLVTISAHIPLPALGINAWLRIVRYTDTRFTPAPVYYSALTSTDGTTWNTVANSTVALNLGGGANGPTLMGIAADASASRELVTSNWANVSITATSSPPPGVCPMGFTCADVGTSHAPGGQTYINPTFTIDGSGDIWDVYDQFRYVWQPMPGDGTVSARVTSISGGTDWQKAGVMIRAGATDPQAPYYGVLLSAQHGVVVQWRATEAAATTQVTFGSPTQTPPIYLMAARYSDTSHNKVWYTAYVSNDNQTWTQVPGSTVALVLPPDGSGNLAAGLVSSSHLLGSTGTAQLDNYSLLGSAPMPAGICPPQWNCDNIGAPTPAGAQTLNNGTWTVTTGGNDDWGTADSSYFLYQPLTGDGTLSTHVVSQTSGGAWAKGGVMMRAAANEPDPSAPYFGVFATPSNGVVVQWRPSEGAQTSQLQFSTMTMPTYLKVNRWTDAAANPPITWYDAQTSTDGNNWTILPGSVMQMPALTGAVNAGLSADSWIYGTAATWTFDTVVLTTTGQQPPGVCAAPWRCEDVGGARPAGSQSFAGGAWSVQAGGGDIWTGADSFHLIAQPLNGDGTVSARVASQSNTNAWAKAGVMLRIAANDPDAGAPYYGAFVTPSHGVIVQWRTAEGAQTNQIGIAGTVPAYLRAVRWTDTSGSTPVTWFTAYTSNDGVNWNAIPGSSMALPISGALLAGLAATSHDQTQLASVTFDSVALTTNEIQPPGVCPAAWSCADIGGARPVGSQTLSGGTWTVSGGGGDIWGTADSYRYVWQQLAGDGTVSAHLASQSNTNAWAKSGVMLRSAANSPDASAPYYGVFTTPSNGIIVQWRTAEAGQTSQVRIAGAAPMWLRAVRWTDTSGAQPVTWYAAYTSTDGTTWNVIPNSTVALPITGAMLAGMAVTSHDQTQLSAVSFDNVTVSATSTQPYGICPAAWTCADLGGATPAGSQNVTNGSWSVNAGGSDIWGTADSFRYMYKTLAGDGTETLRVASLGTTNAWSKGGIMVRASTAAGAAYYAVFLTPQHGIVVQYRTATGAATTQVVANATGTAPVYLRIVRSGTTFSAYTSTDGTTFALVARSQQTIGALAGSLLSGIALTSHDSGNLVNAVFDNITI